MGQAAPFESTHKTEFQKEPDTAEIYTHGILRDLKACSGGDPRLAAAMALSAIAAAEILLRQNGIDRNDLTSLFANVWEPIIEQSVAA